MELMEATQRILRHWLLILVVVCAVGFIPLAVTLTGEDTYVASARMDLDRDTFSTEQAEALVDGVLGVVTSPSLVAPTLDEISAVRDPEQVAEQIDVESVGSSSILVLSVTDPDPDVAVALANALSEKLLAFRRAPLVDPLESRLAQLDDDLAAVREEIDGIEAEALGPAPAIDSLQLRLAEALERRSDIRTKRAEVSATLRAAPNPVLMDRATTSADPSRLVANSIVAGLLGLILGLAAAAVLESLRPTIVGGDALARALGVPVLGRFSDPDRPDADESDLQVAYHLGLAASVAGVSVVRIVGAGHSVDLEHMASRLDTAARDLLANGGPSSSRSMREVVDVVGSYAEGLPWAATEGRNGSHDAVEGGTDISASEISYTEFIRSVDAHRSPPGLVVVAPEVLARSELSKIEHLVAITRWPLLGIVTLHRRRSWKRAATRIEEWPPATQWEDEEPESAVAAARS